MKKNEIYFYLARRDKSGIKFIGRFGHESDVYATKIDEGVLRSLNMNPKASSELLKEMRENRMEYEMFAETASSFEEIRKSLSGRGYSRISTHQFSALKGGKINSSVLVTTKSTMIRRGSSK
jgi:hypothetical protein